MQTDRSQDDEIIDLAEFADAGKPVPKGKKYRIRIDKEVKIVDVDHMTGREILALVGKTPDKFILRQRANGGVHPVGPDDKVSFLDPGVERFMTWPRDSTPWRSTRQSAFALRELRVMLRGPSISRKDWR